MIEAPNEDDIEQIAQSLIHAQTTAREILNVELDGSKRDLIPIQRILDSGQVDRESKYTLQALGIAFGKVFVNIEADYDWWMVDDEYGHDPAVRYKESSLTFHPSTMISKRAEDGEPVDAPHLYESMRARLQEIIEDGVDGG